MSETAREKVYITRDVLDAALEVKAQEYGVKYVRNFEAFEDIAGRTSNQSGKPSLAFPYYFIKLLLTQKLDSIERGLSRSVLLE